MKTTAAAPPCLLALVLAASPAGATGAREQAASFFDAGAEAYKAGQYLVAAEAFLKANELSPSPALLFSAAQAYRRQCLAEPSAPALRKAIGLYREYLKLDRTAKRREDAMQALATLIPLEARFAGEGAADGGEPPKQAPTRLLLSTPAEGAEVSVDGGPFAPAPVVAKVAAGPHQVRVRALGYEEQQLTVQAIANELTPRHVDLRPKPARLTVRGTAGARVAIDGQVRATLPLTGPLAIEPGAHFVAVTATGHEPHGAVVELARDGSADLSADLRPTRQRIGAWMTLAGGAAGAVSAGALGVAALVRQGEASSLANQRKARPLTTAERDRYNGAVAARDGLARAATIAGGASALVLAVGAGLVAVDKPELVPPNDERLRVRPRPAPQIELDVGLLSLGVRGAF